MKPAGAFLAVAAISLFALAACVSQVDRHGTPTAAPTQPPRPTESKLPTQVPTPGGQLFLTVAAPQNGATVPGEAVVVYGLTLPGAEIEVNGSTAPVDKNGGFTAETALFPGVNSCRPSAIMGHI